MGMEDYVGFELRKRSKRNVYDGMLIWILHNDMVNKQVRSRRDGIAVLFMSFLNINGIVAQQCQIHINLRAIPCEQ